MKSSKLLSILAVAGAIVFSASVEAAQPAATGQRGQEGGGIAKLLQLAGATREQIKQFNAARSELRNAPNYRAALQAKLKGILTEKQYKKFEEVWRNRRQGQSKSVSVPAPEDVNKWKTAGFGQANTMGRGEAAIPKSGKFRVFVLMGQSGMAGAARASELKPPHNEKHERIRIWANGRWEYMVPSQRFGPGVYMAHQLAEFWPDDTIGIIKVASGGTGIRGFEKNWSFERAERTFDGKKGSLYQDLLSAVAEARRISKPEFCGFVWRQTKADGTKRDLAEEYYDTFKQLISDLRKDLGAPKLPVFILAHMNDADLLKKVLSRMSAEDLANAKKSAGGRSVKDQEQLQVVLSWLYDNDLPNARKLGRGSPYIATVIMAHNRASREIPNVIAVHPGELPISEDGVHTTAEGQMILGKVTASGVEEFYKANK